MSYDPGGARPNDLLSHDAWYRLFTNLIFDSFVKSIVRDHYHLNPLHVTLQITRTESMLYVKHDAGSPFMAEDEDLREWALGFIAASVFDLDPTLVEQIYLDGAVGSQDAYLYIAGKGILISSGDAKRRGPIL